TRLVERLGRRPIAVKDCPGFVVNRCLVPPFIEACRMLEEGWAPRHVDDQYRSIGMIAGPLHIADLIGLDVVLAVCRHCTDVFGQRFAPPSVLETLVAAGCLGRKTGQGFHGYVPECRSGTPSDTSTEPPRTTIASERLVVPLVNEALRCR